jgi:hypothetical protein
VVCHNICVCYLCVCEKLYVTLDSVISINRGYDWTFCHTVQILFQMALLGNKRAWSGVYYLGHVWIPPTDTTGIAGFAECFLSGTRQRRLCRVPHSVKLGSRQRAPLPSVEHSAQACTRQRQVCRVSNTRQRGFSAKGRQRPSQS